MKKKIFLTIAFLISLIPMVASQYGGIRGVREISGLVNLWNPVGIIAVLAFLLGLWLPLKRRDVANTLCIAGLVFVILAEITMFLTWPIPTYQDHVNLAYSFENAFPEFYLGLTTSALMLITYVCTMSITPEKRRRTTRPTSKSSTTSKKQSRK